MDPLHSPGSAAPSEDAPFSCLQFLRRKWAKEQDYVLRKYLWCHSDNRIAVAFEYEYRVAEVPGGGGEGGAGAGASQWYRAYGNELWEFDGQGLMRKRVASINEAPIGAGQRRLAVPPGEAPLHNTWLEAQGVGGAEFPLRDGSEPCY